MGLKPKSPNGKNTRCLISYGSNLSGDQGSSLDVVETALEDLSSKTISIIRKSGHFRSSAYPKGFGPDFINGVILCDAGVNNPKEVLNILHEIESALGRVRGERWAARVIDLDLLDYSGQILPDESTVARWRKLPPDMQVTRTPPELLLPHPRLQDRAFVLVPLQAVCPDFAHPATGWSVHRMLNALDAKNVADVQPL
ncbi:MAG: 2-amino-4-hydroxy-6-hydroxymethyldihydropteridine diphosphokinase [Rhodobacteraceae bacterium]|nr:2-amino-4-hydroxy-6-hydroxymethyldihydropteridine diphosphokinase [Paracoccaceae bacterium]